MKPSYEMLQQKVATLEKQLDDQKTVKDALKEAYQDREAILRTILNSVPVGITRAQGRVFSLVNDRFNEMLGFNTGELIGKNTRIIYADDEEYDRFGKDLYGQIRQREFGEIEFRIKRKDGKLIDVNLRAVPIDPGDVEKGIISTVLDITDRKRAAEEKKQAEQRIKHLNTVLKAIRDVNKVIIREHDRELLIQAVCDNLVKTRGYVCAWAALFDGDGDVKIVVEAGIGKGFNELLTMMKAGELPVCGQQAMELPGAQVIINKRLTCADCPVDPEYDQTGAMACRLEYDEKIFGIIAVSIPSKWGLDKEEQLLFEEVSQDIAFALHGIQTETERGQMESQLRQAQKMEAIGTLAGGIAHDFNNILSAIIGYTDLAIDEAESDSSLVDYLDQVAKAGRRAKNLVAQILALSRQAKSELMPVQIHLIIKEALKLIHSILPSTIKIHQRIGTFGKVLADPGQIHQIFMNLATNAYHAMRETGGRLEVDLAETVIDTADDSPVGRLVPGPYLTLSVSDTGIGMDSTILPRIFDPYFTTKGKSEGTGLGLAVVHGIVESLGGTITVKSVLGQGSTFTAYLPKLEKEMQAVPAEEKISVPKGNERILFIDDEPALIKMAYRMLKALGYHVTIFNNSIEALERFRNEPEQFDLVITDMTMPRITGDVLAAEIMKIRTDIPVIVCTGFSERIDMEKAKKIGIKTLLMKPLSKSEMAIRIREVLDGKSTQLEPPVGNEPSGH